MDAVRDGKRAISYPGPTPPLWQPRPAGPRLARQRLGTTVGSRLDSPTATVTGSSRRQREMGCGASSSNPALSETKMALIADIPAELRVMCQQTFEALDKDGNGSITLEDSIWAKPFLDAHDIDGDGRVTMNEYLFACSRKIAADPNWTPTVAMLSYKRGASAKVRRVYGNRSLMSGVLFRACVDSHHTARDIRCVLLAGLGWVGALPGAGHGRGGPAQGAQGTWAWAGCRLGRRRRCGHCCRTQMIAALALVPPAARARVSCPCAWALPAHLSTCLSRCATTCRIRALSEPPPRRAPAAGKEVLTVTYDSIELIW